jgi:uncharacterized protein (DUF1015 family)
MAEVRPLRGVRFDSRQTGPIGPLIAAPYDVPDPIQRPDEFGIGLIENVVVGPVSDQHALAAARFRDWRKRGVLRQDALPAIYLHRHRFELDGTVTVRTGLIARVRVTDWSDKIVLPHERTTTGPRVERLQRLRSVGANLSPLYLLYRDPGGQIRDFLANQAARDMPFEGNDLKGGWHQLTTLTDQRQHHHLLEIFNSQTLFMADGHHRYEAALAYRDECRRRFGLNREAPWEFVLVLLAAADDPGVSIRPVHRILGTAAGLNADELLGLLRRWFALRPAADAFDRHPDAGYLFRLILPAGEGSWEVLRLPGSPHHALMPRPKGRTWQSLPIAALQVVLESAIGVSSEQTTNGIALTLDAVEAVRQLDRGDARAAFLMPPPNVDQVIRVAEEGDLMPAKSTWFEPKAPAGLVINELRADHPS